MVAGKPTGIHPDQTLLEDDAALMQRIASGDRSAALALMDRSLSRILAIANRMLADPVEAEDVAQDTFLRAWKAAGRWQPGQARVETWMCRIATNLCLDRLRKRRETAMDTPPEMRDGTVSADSDLVARDAKTSVMEAVKSLPSRQRAALELCHFQEMTNIEAAAEMGISVEALESLLARGRRKLKEILLPQRGDLVNSLSEGAAQAPEVM
ncbi:RNA polymerase sigma factor [Hyphobacterium sp.]|uniref:RNA polymerase sigma factor n=1 Tax=Hyphobacterium sp. TaxID=2004662 RepID=UPI003BA8E4F5